MIGDFMLEAPLSARPDELPWPPPPHDPAERVAVDRVGEWEVRVSDPKGPFHTYFARRGMLHVQLWHPEAEVSVLTRSKITANRFEVFPYQSWKRPCFDLAEVRAAVRREHGLSLPSAARLEAIERWFVRVPNRD